MKREITRFAHDYTDSRKEEDLSLQHLFISGMQCMPLLIWFGICFCNTGLDAEIQKALLCACTCPKDHQDLQITLRSNDCCRFS